MIPSGAGFFPQDFEFKEEPTQTYQMNAGQAVLTFCPDLPENRMRRKRYVDNALFREIKFKIRYLPDPAVPEQGF